MLLTNAIIAKYFCKQKLLVFIIFFSLVVISNILFYSLNWEIFLNFEISIGNNWTKLLTIILLTFLFVFPFWPLVSFLIDKKKLKIIISQLSERDLFIYSKIKTSEIYKLASNARLQLTIFKKNEKDLIKFQNLISDWIKNIKVRINV
ncbi:MAG: hypothetical protein ACRC9U_00810 [Metamycoplasmataceae bacterium]